MGVLVQKYGGSSLADTERLNAVASRVAATHHSGAATVVVVSARGGATDELLAQAAAAAGPAFGAQRLRETDQLLATGETASASLLALTLLGLGVPAVSLTGAQAGMSIVGKPGAGIVDRIDVTRIDELLDEGNVVVVTGFQGQNADGDTVTLGRGGSDTSAVALAAALGAERCEIFTDVDGVYSADPTHVPDARKLPFVPAAVMAEMAFAGAKVLHPRAVELATLQGVELHVRTSLGTQEGTVVGEEKDFMTSLETGGAVVAITSDPDVARVLVHARGRSDLAAEVLSILAQHAVPMDLVARSGPNEEEFRMGFTVRRSDVADIGPALDKAIAVHGGEVRIDPDVAKVSLIGMGLLNRPEYVARMTAVLAAAGIATSWVSSSQLRASVTVPADRRVQALCLLHKEFGQTEECADTEQTVAL
ncbi:aspartate kinase [Streptomyces globisporus]|uniref:aspartate kinase n=1 Tax=Streptomyces sp. MCL20-2 TaxID=2967219 RepID=UPI0029663D95|nr:aspartate kinase [Streptomyces sp. MCL20-2]